GPRRNNSRPARRRPAVPMSPGGEGGIRTRGAFAHRFSRAAPSTTRTPLRGRGYQRDDSSPLVRSSLATSSTTLRGPLEPGLGGAAGWCERGDFLAAALGDGQGRRGVHRPRYRGSAEVSRKLAGAG